MASRASDLFCIVNDSPLVTHDELTGLLMELSFCISTGTNLLLFYPHYLSFFKHGETSIVYAKHAKVPAHDTLITLGCF